MNKIIKQGPSSSLGPYYQYHEKCYCRLCLKLRKKISYKQQATSNKQGSNKQQVAQVLVILLDNLIVGLYKRLNERIKNND